MKRALVSLIVMMTLLVPLAPAANAESGGIADARVGLQDSHGWITPQQLQRYGTVRGLSVVFTYSFGAEIGEAQQPYDFHQVRYSINRGPEKQIDSVDAHKFTCCLAQPGTHYVFKVQGCRRGTFGSDCTAWFERDLDTPSDPTPRPPAPAPLPRTPAPSTPLPTPRHIVLPHLPTPTPAPYALNAPKVIVAASTQLQCSRLTDAAAKVECIARVRNGEVLVRWTWQRTPCNAVTCYEAESYVVSGGAAHVALPAAERSVWIRPDDSDGCVQVTALHNVPTVTASGSGCPRPRPPKGRPI